MARVAQIMFASSLFCAVMCKPLEPNGNTKTNIDSTEPRVSRIWKRFINPSMSMGNFADIVLPKMRTKRSTSEEDCEKLQLCKLHARSNSNFFAAYELYFVNKENAKLWDHHAHSAEDCERRFTCGDEPARAQPPRRQYKEFVDDDYY